MASLTVESEVFLWSSTANIAITKDTPVSEIVSQWENAVQVMIQHEVPPASIKALKEHFQGKDPAVILRKLNEAADTSNVSSPKGA